MLTNRQENILKLIVKRYIQTAKPVSSKLICKTLKCSSATIRNEMAHLEEVGLLEKTHTSSGRVPSEKGYRYYVDYLLDVKEINQEDMEKLAIIFQNKQLALSDCIEKSLQVISDATSYTTIVLGNTSHDNLLKQIEVVPISEKEMIVIVITDKGHLDHKTITLDNVSQEDIRKTVSIINNMIVGTPIDEVSAKLEFEVRPIIGKYVRQHEQLYQTFYHVFEDFQNKSVSILGQNNMLKQPEFSSIDKIREIYNKLGNQEVLSKIEEDDDKNIKIYIGRENSLDNDMTVVKTRFKVPGEEGTIAIIGPKRMEYDRVLAMLEFIRENLER